jgi:glycosyltransferase involved in cell wall biosynthesis
MPPGVSFLGPLPPQRLRELHRIAQVFVLPSTGEVFPIAAQEALASGVPMVLTDSPDYDRYAVDRDLLRLVPADPETLRRTIAEIVGDEDLRRRMSAYSRHLAETYFDAAAAEDALVTLYDPPPGADVPAHRQEEDLWTSPLSS